MNESFTEIDPEDHHFFYIVYGKQRRRFSKVLMGNEMQALQDKPITEEVFERLIQEERVLIRKAWVQCLARKSYWKDELRKKLLKKGFSPEGVASEIEACEQKGYLNDHLQVERWISKTFAKGQGAQAVYFHLKQKGVVLASEDPLHQFICEEEVRSLKAFLQKKKGKDLSGPRGIRYLLQRGYRYEAIEKFY